MKKQILNLGATQLTVNQLKSITGGLQEGGGKMGVWCCDKEGNCGECVPEGNLKGLGTCNTGYVLRSCPLPGGNEGNGES